MHHDKQTIITKHSELSDKEPRATFRKSTIAALVLANVTLAPSATSFANENENALEVITITATRTEKPISEVASSVTVINAAQIQREIANGIDDLIRYEPGVSVGGSGRFGLNSFTIRGVSGDRILTLVDSTPTADEFSFGPFLSSRRDFVDIDTLKSVEIVRGPGSSVYGSNAIGGVVNFITKDPVDYLGEKNFAGTAKTGYSSVDNSSNTTVLAAFGNQTWSAMVAGTYREGSENETFFNDDISGPDRRSENPQDSENQNIYAKLVYSPNDSQSLSLVAERFEGETETNVVSAQGTFVRGVLVNSEIGDDQRTRERLSLNYQLDSNTSLFDSLSILAYHQDSDAEQNTFSERVSFTGSVEERVRDSFFQQENVGFRLQLNKILETGNIQHELTYGIDYDESESSTLRQGGTTDQLSGTVIPEFLPFPTRDFPESEYETIGAFVQDDIRLLDGRLHIIPGLRYDSFELTPEADEIFFFGNPGAGEPSGYDESELSVKLGAVLDLSDTWSAFAQFSQGFRAPPLDAINTGFTNLAGGYTTLSNPDLIPETAESYELGIRRFSDAGSLELAVYQNDYENFIESLSVLGFNPLTGLLEFQARNLDNAQIKGVELKAQYNLGALSSRLDGFNVRAAYAYSDGENEQDNTPLNSIDPQQLVFGLAYASNDNKWGIEAVLVATDRKSNSDIDSSSLADGVEAFETPGYTTLDLIGHYKLGDNAKINWGVFNATDKKYFQWSEELVQDPSTTNFDRLTDVGRNYSVTVNYSF